MNHELTKVIFGIAITLAGVRSAGADAVFYTVPTGIAPEAIAIDSATDMIYVANYGSGSVTKINGSTYDTTIIKVEGYPQAIAVDPVTDMIYAASAGSNTVTKINGSNNDTTIINVGGNPFAIAVNPATDMIFVANKATNTVTEINGSTNATTTIPAGIAPDAIAVNPATDMIYVANYGSLYVDELMGNTMNDTSGSVTVINGSTNATAAVAAGGNRPCAVAVNPATDMIYVANYGSLYVEGTVTAINGSTNATTTIGYVGMEPDAIAVNPVTDMIYVANYYSGTVTIINGVTNATSSVGVGGYPTSSTEENPDAIAVNAATNMIYVANDGGNTVTEINGESNAATTIAAGYQPWAIAVNPVNNMVFAANYQSNNVVVMGDGPPGAPTLASPSNSASNQPTTLTLSWNTDPGAATYDVQVSTSTSFITALWSQMGYGGLSTSVSGFANGTTYYWEVRATNAVGTGAWSSVWSFTAIPGTPPVPVLSSPSSGAVNQPTTLTLSWESVTGAATYYDQVSTSTSFNTVVWAQMGYGGLSASVSGLANGTTYFWEVSATNQIGPDAWSSVWSFTTVQVAPGVPALSSPTNGAANVAPSVSLSWIADSGGLATSYNVHVSTNSSIEFDIVSLNVTEESASLSGLLLNDSTSYVQNNTTYYWKVRATNTGGTSAWSSVWSFTITPPTTVLSQKAVAFSKGISFSNSAIAYELPAASSVSIVLYDMQGRQVRQLVNGMQNAGRYRINFNRARVTAGYYIVEFKAGAFVVQKKLALID